MNLTFVLYGLIITVTLFSVSCSSIPVPSLPSLPWSSSAPEANPEAEALFREGMEYFNNKKYALAISRFQRVKTEFAFSPEVPEAELKLAQAYYLNKQYPEAISALQEFHSLHPTNPNIPFVLYHLGLAHLDQFTSVEREQKITETAKGYFESVIRHHSNSPYAGPSQEKLAKCLEYLAEHEFAVASFYLKKEKYPAARDRLEGIVRRYQGTPAAARALYHLGEAYRLEKNTVKAALAYSAFVQRYPEHELAGKAQEQLAQVTQEKQDPLALLLMRDGRPTTASAAPAAENAVSRPANLVAKKDVVYEQPGADKGLFRRVVDKVNPFASAEKDNDEKTASASAKVATAKKEPAEEGGLLASLWQTVNPFAKDEKPKLTADPDPQLVSNVDKSLKQKGIQPGAQTLTAPATELPNVSPEPASDPANAQNVLRDVDTKLDKHRPSVAALPPPPEAHPVFHDPAAKEKLQSVDSQPPQVAPSAGAASVLSTIDQKLKRKGVDPTKVELPVPVKNASSSQAPSESARSQKVELDSRLPAEKGPLFLGEAERNEAGKVKEEEERNKKDENKAEPATPANPSQLPEAIVKGAPPRVKETTLDAKPEESGALPAALDQIRKDAEAVEKLINPFKW